MYRRVMAFGFDGTLVVKGNVAPRWKERMIHRLQMEVTLARERIKQLEQVIESPGNTAPLKKPGKEPRRRNCEAPPREVSEDHRRLSTVQ